MEPKDYMKKHSLLTYIEDLTGILLENRYFSKSFPKVHPISVIQEYFHTVLTGIHVYQREFNYVSATPYNRACFIRMIWQCYHQGLSVHSKGKMSCWEYYQLLQLLCHDFPTKFTDQTKALFSNVHSSEDVKISFSDFMYVIQVVFYYKDFVIECERLFEKYAKGINPVKGVVVLPKLDTPTTDTPTCDRPTSPEPATPITNNMDDMYDAILRNARDDDICSPSIDTIEKIIAQFKLSGKSDFEDFLIALCNNENVNSDIGVLPPKDLFNDTIPPSIGQLNS